MNKKLLFIPLFVFLGLVAVFATQLIKNSHGDDPTKLESVLVGKSVPEFRLEDLAGKASFMINPSLKVSHYC